MGRSWGGGGNREKEGMSAAVLLGTNARFPVIHLLSVSLAHLPFYSQIPLNK